MKSKPTIERRPDQTYVGTRVVLSMSDFEYAIPAMTRKVEDWLEAKGLKPTGRPFLRYHVVDMPNRLDVELGIPTTVKAVVSEEFRSGTLPSGRYAMLTYKGVKDGIPANKRLIDWIHGAGEEVDSETIERGEAFASRYETFLVGGSVEPDQDKWETEVAIRLQG